MPEMETAPFDAAAYLDSEERVRLFIADAFETGDPAYVAKALGIAARARNMTHLAEQAGLTRQALYKALSGEGKPEFATIMKVARALGLDITVKTHEADAA